MPLWLPAHASRIDADPQGDLVGTDVDAQLGEIDTRLGYSLREGPDVLADYAWWVDEFLGGPGDGGQLTSGEVGQLGWRVKVAGSGDVWPHTSVFTFAVFPDTGGIRLRTQGGASDLGMILLGDRYVLGNSPEMIWQARVRQVDADSDATDTYKFVAGFGDTEDGSAFTEGMWFELDHNANANWQINCADSGTTTTADSGVAAAASGTWTTLKIVCDGAGNMHFYVDGTETSNSPITTNLPGTSLADSGYGPQFFIRKSAGTNARKFELDYFYLKRAR